MCDGTKHDSGLIFCTDSFTLQEVQLLMNAQKDNFGLVSTYHTETKSKKVYYRIYLGTDQQQLLNSLVLSHIIPSMLYKLHI